MTTTTARQTIFQRGELSKIKKRNLSAVVLLDVGGRIDLGATTDPRSFARHYTSTKAPCRIAHVLWTAGPPLARRVRDGAADILAGRRTVEGGLFNVPLNFAVGAVEVAATKIGARLRSTEIVLKGIREEDECRTRADLAAINAVHLDR